MGEQTTISVDSIMEQAQVFASAWALVGGPFDKGNALENAEDEKIQLHDMLEEFCSNSELSRIAEQLVAWHQRKIGLIEQVLASPADTEVQLGVEAPILLTGEALKGFRVGLLWAQSIFGAFPLQVATIEMAGEK
ncbi:hypothetical protein [Pseudomonas asplenii]|uniref:Host nuclease inhibitor protein n=1 Tax=Pseudomonas asplenii TaxID=53407 RepID=A0A1H6NWX0_9PSED|nr:hypothetical protein [Pseudomonas fuscovaginae]SEI21413.1 hypothetical protein SAMN05216581_4494 [Pseudomonas fuscovaginae]